MVFQLPLYNLHLLYCLYIFCLAGKMGSMYKDEQDDWVTVCLKYLLFVFNFLFWVSLERVCPVCFLLFCVGKKSVGV